MTTKAKVRQIVQIDEEKCNGCGLCVPNCAEGAIRIIDGKARLVADNLCDGLGACMGHCPEDAITITERAADEFCEKAVEKHLGHKGKHGHEEENMPRAAAEHIHAHMSGGCPGARILDLNQEHKTGAPRNESRKRAPSRLSHWPIKLMLIPPNAPFLRGHELLLTADCVGVVHPALHDELLEGKAIAIACPKFDDVEYYLEKLTEIVKNSGITGITVVHMEVPCCSGLNSIARKAVENAGSDIPVKNIVIGIRGDQLR